MITVCIFRYAAKRLCSDGSKLASERMLKEFDLDQLIIWICRARFTNKLDPDFPNYGTSTSSNYVINTKLCYASLHLARIAIY